MGGGGDVQRSGSSAFQPYATPPVAPPQGAGDQSLARLTVALVKTYQQCSPAFRYSSRLAPRRLLTKPAEPASNSGWDNASHDLIVAVGDEFVSSLGSRYVVRDLLGQGTFGQVFKCVSADEPEGGEAIAIKVVKNQAAYYHQARVEVGVLQFLNARADPADQHHIVRLKDFFLYRNHLCLAFELLSLNLYELIRHNKFRGLSLSLVRVFVSQILDAMAVLRDSRIIHCDLKPENVLLKNVESGEVKVIDFGSACFESRTVYSYIQSRFYRSPEVVLGYPYAMAIDMWSLGCVAAELFLGLPLFPGACEHDLLGRIASTLGPLPDFLLASGKNARKFFAVREELALDPFTGEQVVRQRFVLRSRQQFEELTGQPAPTGKQYFQHSALADIIGAYPLRSGLSDDEVTRERALRESFTDFLLGVLDVNPSTRWSPRQAAKHPFVTGERFTGPFQPLPDPSTSPAIATPGSASRPAPAASRHTPGMQIPVASAAARQAAAAARGEPAAVAASPWAAAAAHAAAVAAMQQRYGSSYQGQYTDYQAQYNVAHSLQNIVIGLGGTAGLASQLAGSYGVAAMQTTPPAQSLSSSYAPLLSPPSRSFHTQLRYSEHGSLLQPQHSGEGLHGAMSLLQTPTSGGCAVQPFSPGSFQPSSISTYHAALAAAQAALTQQQPGTAGPLSPYSRRQAGAAATAASAGLAGSWRGDGWPVQQQQQQATSLSGFAPPPTAPGIGAASAASRAALPAGMLRSALAGAAVGAAGMASSSRWASMDGSSPGGTPPLGRPPSGEAAPHPADFDPLWSDALLEEEQAQQDGQAADAAPNAKRQHVQVASSGGRREPPLGGLLPTALPAQQTALERIGSSSQHSQQHQAAAVAEATRLSGNSPAADPLALAAQCLPQLAALHQQQQGLQGQQTQQAHRHVQLVAGPPPLQQQGLSVHQAMQAAVAQAAAAQQVQAAVAAQQQQQQQQQQQAGQLNSLMLSAFGSAADGATQQQHDTDAAAAADAAAAQQQQQQQQQLALLHEALSLTAQHSLPPLGGQHSLSLGMQHSTGLTDGFASYTLQDAPSVDMSAAVAAAAAATLAQQQAVTVKAQAAALGGAVSQAAATDHQRPIQRHQGFFSPEG